MTAVEVSAQSEDAGMALVRAASVVMDAIREATPAVESEQIAADLDAIRDGSVVSLPVPEHGF